MLRKVAFAAALLTIYSCDEDGSNAVLADQDVCYGFSGVYSRADGEVRIWPYKNLFCMASGPNAAAEIVRRNKDGTFLVHISKRWRPFLGSADYAVCSIKKNGGDLKISCGHQSWLLHEMFS